MSNTPSQDQTPAIQVQDLTKHYGRLKAIDRITFSVQPGEIVGFLGPNGAGKSTTMRILCGLMSATSGKAFICGHSVAGKPHLSKRHLGYMPEHNPLPSDMRVIEYLRYRARLKELHGKRQRQAVDEAMEVCDLHRKARRRLIGNLSKGFRQRVGIADAILAKPEVIIMDEPTIGLDPHQILGIRRLIDSLRGRMTVVLSSHILPEIELVCDRVIIINQGRVVASGTPPELRQEFIPEASYRLVVEAERTALESALNAISPHLRWQEERPARTDGFLSILLEDRGDLALGDTLLSRLASAPGLRLREVAEVHPTLEDVFMASTRRSWDETLSPFPNQTPASEKAS